MPSQDETYVMAIDLGTSGPKVALISDQGAVVDYVFEATELLLFPNGGAEQKPEEWWQSICRASQRLMARRKVPVDAVKAVCCTAQWSGTVAVDQQGHALMNAVIWMDSRGAPYIQDITGGWVKIQGYGLGKLLTWLHLTGGIPTRSGKDSIAHILYIKHEFPDIYQQTYKFLEPKDYINLRLTGQFAASYDSIALHWLTDNRNIARVCYHPRLVKMAGVNREKLPELKRAVDILGPITPSAASALGTARETQVVMGTPDVQSAAIGSGAVNDFQGHLYIGTSSWLTCHVPYKKTDIFHNMAALPSPIPGRYFIANEQETAGACLTFLRDNILYHKDALPINAQPPHVYKLFDRIASNTPAGSGRVIFSPWLYGERTPVENHTVRGGFHNVSLNTNREHLIRAVYEGVAFNAKWLLGYVEKFIKHPMESLNMIGGGANSDVWCQIHADILNRTIKQIKDPILANARGAGFLALAALGRLAFDDIPGSIQISATYTPKKRHRKIYDNLFKEFRSIYNRNCKIYARLNRSE